MEVFLLLFVRRMRTFGILKSIIIILSDTYFCGLLILIYLGFFGGGGGGVGPPSPPQIRKGGGYMDASTHRFEASTILITLFLLSHPRPKSTKLTN